MNALEFILVEQKKSKICNETGMIVIVVLQSTQLEMLNHPQLHYNIACPHR